MSFPWKCPGNAPRASKTALGTYPHIMESNLSYILTSVKLLSVLRTRRIKKGNNQHAALQNLDASTEFDVHRLLIYKEVSICRAGSKYHVK